MLASSRVWQFASSPVWISTSVNRVPHGPQAMSLGVHQHARLILFFKWAAIKQLFADCAVARKNRRTVFRQAVDQLVFRTRTRSIVPNVSRCCGRRT